MLLSREFRMFPSFQHVGFQLEDKFPRYIFRVDRWSIAALCDTAQRMKWNFPWSTFKQLTSKLLNRIPAINQSVTVKRIASQRAHRIIRSSSCSNLRWPIREREREREKEFRTKRKKSFSTSFFPLRFYDFIWSILISYRFEKFIWSTHTFTIMYLFGNLSNDWLFLLSNVTL